MWGGILYFLYKSKVRGNLSRVEILLLKCVPEPEGLTVVLWQPMDPAVILEVSASWLRAWIEFPKSCLHNLTTWDLVWRGTVLPNGLCSEKAVRWQLSWGLVRKDPKLISVTL